MNDIKFIKLSDLNSIQFLTLLNECAWESTWIDFTDYNPKGNYTSLVFQKGSFPYIMYTYECGQNGYTESSFEEIMENILNYG